MFTRNTKKLLNDVVKLENKKGKRRKKKKNDIVK